MASKMTENSRKVLETLKANPGVKFLTAELAEKAGVTASAVTGSVTGLCKKGYAVREPQVMTGADGKEKEVKLISITDAGLSFDPDAEVIAE